MSKKSLLWSAFAALALLVTIVQFIPSEPVLVPSQLPVDQRESHRLLNFEGISNFRDLGGYATTDGKTVTWGKLYRSANFSETSRADQKALDSLSLKTLVDFRSAAEKEEEPNQLTKSPSFNIVEIPIMDGGDNSVSEEIIARFESGNFSDFDPNQFMIDANRQFASSFTPQFSAFIQQVLDAEGQPIVWHCSAGKDRTGFAAAILLRMLGVSRDVIMQDYMLSREYSLAARQKELTLVRLLQGEEAADKLEILLGVEEAWLQAAFDAIDEQYGSFDNYVDEALSLEETDIARLRNTLLE
ncbi:MAG: tyrosine-protein phosphatase [Halioglobus sp.]